MKKKYNPDGTIDGFETTYWISKKTLYIESRGANSFWDWMNCIFGALLKPKKYNSFTFHRKWFLMAFKFYRYIKHIEKLEFESIKMKGHSLGGAINDILCYLFCNDTIDIEHETYGSPKSNKEGIIMGCYYYNRGDFVPWLPPWYKEQTRIILNKKWKPVWISHKFYDWRFK